MAYITMPQVIVNIKYLVLGHHRRYGLRRLRRLLARPRLGTPTRPARHHLVAAGATPSTGLELMHNRVDLDTALDYANTLQPAT